VKRYLFPSHPLYFKVVMGWEVSGYAMTVCTSTECETNRVDVFNC